MDHESCRARRYPTLLCHHSGRSELHECAVLQRVVLIVRINTHAYDDIHPQGVTKEAAWTLTNVFYLMVSKYTPRAFSSADIHAVARNT